MTKSFYKGKHKIADRWENTPYIIKEQTFGFPVYKVVIQDTDGKEKPYVLHRDLVFPLAMKNKCEVAVPKQDTEEDQEYWLVDEEPEYTGPIMTSVTRAKVKALAKANILMDSHFEQVEDPLEIRYSVYQDWYAKIARGVGTLMNWSH